MKRIQCWSGPRNVSTALMYSWRQRADTTVVDEPLYAHYLSRDDRSHPGVAEVLASQSTDPDEVIREIILGPCPTPVLYVKQMAHHLRGVDRSHLRETENIILTRHPREMLASLSIQLPECDLSDTGLLECVELLDAVLAEGGRPVVVESQTLLRDPERVLTKVCQHVGLEFDPAMLSWPAGPKPEDGVWAPHWYAGVHRSTCFGPPSATERSLPPRQQAVLDTALPLYERLTTYAVA
ncbi:MAG: hypothetical protein R2707_15240 [Acidimicrobiales bacterium]